MNECSGSDPEVAERTIRELSMIGLKARSEQILVSDMLELIAKHDDGSVGFVEAPTATGKTIVMARHALQCATEQPKGECVVMAAPSIEVCIRTIEACNLLTTSIPAYRKLVTRIIFGRQEFVSHDRILELATALAAEGRDDDSDAISKWIDQGAPGPSEAYPAYARQGLLHATDGAVEAPEWTLLNQVGPEDRADAAHKAQFLDADVIVVTHAMLARDLVKRYIESWRAHRQSGAASSKNRKWDETLLQLVELEADAERLLPTFRRLIVDEAHLLENNVRSALSTTVSIRQLRGNMRALSATDSRKVPARSVAMMDSAYDRLTRMRPDDADRVRIDWTSPKGFDTIIEDMQDALTKVKRPKAGSIDDADLERASRAIREALNHRNSVSTSIVWSPGHRYPSLSIGPRSLSGRLAFMWRTLRSAALVSATLYTDNKDGPSLRFMAESLGVGPDQRIATQPILPTWQVDPVTFHIPGEDCPIPPPPHADHQKKAWVEEVCRRILDITEGSKTGTLVLCRSRSMTSEIIEGLTAVGIDENRMIDGTKGTLTQLRARYERAMGDARRPIWVTQGPAWTGLDLPDDALDTLVIPALPFPPPRPGSTAGANPSYDGEQVARMMITMKQGVGRLVRSRSAGAKRAFLLDGRINGKGAATAALGLVSRYRIIRFR